MLNVLEKIMLELKPNSPELANEINEKESRINGTDAKIVFKNTSYIKVVTAGDSSRGNLVAPTDGDVRGGLGEKSGRLTRYRYANQSGRPRLKTRSHATHRRRNCYAECNPPTSARCLITGKKVC